MKSVVFNSSTKLPCSCDESPGVVLCLSDSTPLAPILCADDTQNYTFTTLDGTLTRVWTATDGCGVVTWNYLVSYDENLLADPTQALLQADVTGIFCRSCLTQYIDEVAGDEVSLVQNSSNSWTFTSQHGCTQNINIAGGGVCVTDSSSIDLSIDEGGCVTGEVKISADADNQIEIHSDGLFSTSAVCVTDSSSIDFSLDEGGCVTGDVSVSEDAYNRISIVSDGIYSNILDTVIALGDVPASPATILTAGITILNSTTNNGVTVDTTMAIGEKRSLHVINVGSNVPLINSSGSDTFWLNNVVVSPTGTSIQYLEDGKTYIISKVAANTYFVDVAKSTCVAAATNSLTLGIDANGCVTGDVKVSSALGNQIASISDGLYASAGGFPNWRVLTTHGTVLASDDVITLNAGFHDITLTVPPPNTLYGASSTQSKLLYICRIDLNPTYLCELSGIFISRYTVTFPTQTGGYGVILARSNSTWMVITGT